MSRIAPHCSLIHHQSLPLPVALWRCTDLVMKAPCTPPYGLPAYPMSCGVVGAHAAWTGARACPRPSSLIILIILPQISARQAAGICPQLIKVLAH